MSLKVHYWQAIIDSNLFSCLEVSKQYLTIYTPATSSGTTMGLRIEGSICKIIRIESKYDLGKISSTQRIKQVLSESPQPFYHEGVQEYLKDTQ